MANLPPYQTSKEYAFNKNVNDRLIPNWSLNIPFYLSLSIYLAIYIAFRDEDEDNNNNSDDDDVEKDPLSDTAFEVIKYLIGKGNAKIDFEETDIVNNNNNQQQPQQLGMFGGGIQGKIIQIR